MMAGQQITRLPPEPPGPSSGSPVSGLPLALLVISIARRITRSRKAA